MKKQRTILSLLLVVVLLMSMMPIFTVSATEQTSLTKVEKWNLVLCDEIKANFYLSVSDSVSADAVVNVTDGYGTTAYALSQLEKDSKGLYVFTARLAAAQLADEITLQLQDGETLGDVHTYTAVQYARAILTGNYAAETKALVKQMLNYGAAAQKYFKYNTDNLANVGYENDTTPTIPEASTESAASGQVEGISYYGASLLFESQIGVRFYFDVSGDINDYTFTVVDGDPLMPQQKGSRYYIDVLNINPQQYDAAIALSVSDGTDTMTVSYSPMRYISRKYHGSDNAALVDLVGAMYTYHTAAKDYLAAGGTAYRGTAYTAGKNTNFNFAEDDYDIVSFDYVLTTEGQIAVAIRSPGDVPYYGLYYFNANGAASNYPGITCEKQEDGYIRVTCVLDGLYTTNNAGNRANAPKTINKINLYSSSSANAYIDNVVASKDEAMSGEHGAITYAGYNCRFPATLADYDFVSFTYKLLTNTDKNGYIAVRIPSSGDVPYYGLFYFYADGGEYDGVTCEPLEDGYIKVTINLDEVNRTNNQNNRDNVPPAIKGLDVHLYSTADARIDDIQFYNAEVVRGEATTAGVTKRFSFALDDYDYVSFEYKLTSNVETGKISVRIPSSGDVPYYGIYDFKANGGTYDGITFEKLEDGYMKVTMKLDELQKTNNANNRDNVPESVKAVDIYAWSNADALIDNVQAWRDEVVRGEATTAGVTKRFSFALDDYDYVSFEYKLTSNVETGKISVRIPSSGDVPYYGIYDFKANGGTYDGITFEKLEDGYMKVTMKLDELQKTNNANNRNNVPESVKAVDIYAWSNADALIDNVQAYKEEVIRGTATTAGVTSTLTFSEGNYQSISFEYRLTSEGKIVVMLRSPGDVPYYGSFDFNANGELSDYAGVTCEKLEDGYIRATLVLDELTRTNNAGNRDNVPATISKMSIYSWSTANALVDNITMKERPVNRGDALTAGTDWVASAETAAYEAVSVDYKITNDGQIAIALEDDAGEYFGYYYFNAAGEVEDYAGVSCLKRSDEYIKVTFHIAELTLNSGWAPARIAAVRIIGSESTAEGYADNAVFKMQANPAGIRVGILSDTHVGTNGNNVRAERFEHALNVLKNKGVDAIIVAGDLQDATSGVGAEEYIETFAEVWFKVFPDNTNPISGDHVEPIFIYGNHDQTLVADKYWPSSLGEYSDAYVKEVNGYYFVGAHFWQEKEAKWLVEHAQEDSNGYPFFYIQHCPLTGTLFDSESEYFTTGKTVLNQLWDASNAITFTGHIHVPSSDERSIWQSADPNDPQFTAISVPSMNYSYLGEVGLSYIGSSDLCQQGMYMVVEGTEVEITRLDFGDHNSTTGEQIGETWSFDAGDPTDKPYDYETRAAAVKPAFAQDAQITVGSMSTTGVTFSFPAATVTPPEGFSDQIQLYNVEVVKTATGEVIYTQTVINDYMANDKPENYAGPYNISVTGLEENTEYEIRVTAREFYQVDSEPLTLTINTADVVEEELRGEATTAGTTKRFSFALADYDVVSFEYKLTSNQDKNGNICVRLPSSGDVPYYGLFYFTATGGTYDGVTCQQLADGYIRVTIHLDQVNRTNNANNRDNVPASIKAVDIHAYSTADAYIDNVQAYNAE